MKNLTIGFLTSFLIHAFSFLFLFSDRSSQEKSFQEIPIALYPELPVHPSIPQEQYPFETSASPSTEAQPAEPSGDGIAGIQSAGSGSQASGDGGTAVPNGIEYSKESRYVPVPDTTRSLLFTWKRSGNSFREALVKKPVIGESVQKKVLTWFSSPGSKGGWTRPDPASDYLQAQRGSSPALPLPKAQPPEKTKIEQHPARFDFIPNPVQLNAMASVYQLKQATQNDIYASLDPVLIVTAEGLNANLEFLVKKGFLKRKKISPEHPFTFGTLFGGATIELSRKNKLNPMYLYTPSVDRTLLISFFEAQIFLLKETLQETPSDSLYIRHKIDNLVDMIQVLIQTS